MCPACYINALLLFMFGSAGATVASNPVVIALSILFTIAGIWFLIKGYKKNKGKGGLATNIRNTVVYILIFSAGFVTASYVTHDYFKSQHPEHPHMEH